MNPYSIYKHCPLFLQNVLFTIQGYRIEKQRFGKDFYQYLEHLIESDSWTVKKIQAYKEENTFKILEYAYKHCAYYKDKYSELGLTPSDFTGMESLSKFPILTKEEVRENWRGMISDEYNKSELIPYHTSGSTGKALDFFWTKEVLQFYWAVVWRNRHRFGIHKGDKHINFTGKIVVPVEQERPPYWRYNRARNQYMLNMQHITEKKIDDIVKFLNSTNAQFWTGYPSIIHSLTTLMDEYNLQLENPPKFIFTSSEKMYENQRMLIEKVLGSQIVEHYGFSEQVACASKCKNNVYHEDFELGHLELKDPITLGSDLTGVMLATGFKNYGMPFIRYEIGDTGTFCNDKCSCGLNSQVIKDIEGRNGDYVITPEGAHIMRFGYIFKQTEAIKECQVVQRELGKMTIRIVKRNNYSKLTEINLIKAVRDWVSPTILVDFEYVDEIPRTKAGKFKAVISELK